MSEEPKASFSEDLAAAKPHSSPKTENIQDEMETSTLHVKLERLGSEEPSSPPQSPSPAPVSMFLQVKYESPPEEVGEGWGGAGEGEGGSEQTHEIRKEHSLLLTCHICQRMFGRKCDLIRHVRNCLVKKPIQCLICYKTFKNNYRLKSHQRRHETGTPYYCDICNQHFKHKTSIQRHKMLHDNLKPYACPECGKRFTSRCLMKPHFRIHTQEKPFQCAICLKFFAHKHNMERHMLLHNKVKHLTCQICYKSFPRESRLKYHMRVHWADNKPFKCNHCKKSYSCRQNIVRHYRKKHPQEKYEGSETDAALATKEWPKMLQQITEQENYIVPEVELGEKEKEDSASETDDDVPLARRRNISTKHNNDDIPLNQSCKNDLPLKKRYSDKNRGKTKRKPVNATKINDAITLNNPLKQNIIDGGTKQCDDVSNDLQNRVILNRFSKLINQRNGISIKRVSNDDDDDIPLKRKTTDDIPLKRKTTDDVSLKQLLNCNNNSAVDRLSDDDIPLKDIKANEFPLKNSNDASSHKDILLNESSLKKTNDDTSLKNTNDSSLNHHINDQLVIKPEVVVIKSEPFYDDEIIT